MQNLDLIRDHLANEIRSCKRKSRAAIKHDHKERAAYYFGKRKQAESILKLLTPAQHTSHKEPLLFR